MNWLSDTAMLVLSVVLFCAAAACGWLSAFLIEDAVGTYGKESALFVGAGLFLFGCGTVMAYEAWTLL